MSDHGESTENNIQLSGTASETSSAGSPLECGEYEVHGSKLLDDDHLLMGLSVRELNKWLMVFLLNFVQFQYDFILERFKAF